MFAEDLTVFFSDSEHAKYAAWTSPSSGVVQVLGNFETSYTDGQGMVSMQTPSFMTALAWMPGVAKDQQIVIDTVTYKVGTVKRNEPDIDLLTIKLERQQP